MLSIFLTAFCVFYLPFTAYSHGYVKNPISRSFACNQKIDSNCGAIQWEPQSIEGPSGFPATGPSDGKLASGGKEQFSNLDEQSATRWEMKNSITAGKKNITWFFTANHRTRNFRYYMTKQNWDSNKPLTRAQFDLTPFCTLSYGGQHPPITFTHECLIPGRTGYQIIYAVWEIADTTNSFYNVIDVNFGGHVPTSTGAPVTTTASPTLTSSPATTTYTKPTTITSATETTTEKPATTTKPTPVPTVPDFSHCTKVIAIPGNPASASDQSCAPCANGAQKWWPCNVPGLCQCANDTTTVPVTTTIPDTTTTASPTLTSSLATTTYTKPTTITSATETTTAKPATTTKQVPTTHSPSSGVQLSPYVDVMTNATWSDWVNYPQGRPNSFYSKSAIELGVDTLFLGFMTATGGQAKWVSSSFDWVKPFTDELHAGGVKVAISFGGASGSDISSALSVDELIKTYQAAIDTFGASVIDLDIEGGSFQPEKAFPALASVLKKNPNVQLVLTLPVLPEGLTNRDWQYVLKAKAANLDFVVNIMTMDYGKAVDNMGAAAVSAAENTKKQLATIYPGLSDAQLYAKVGIIPMIGQNDTPNEVFSFQDVTTVCEFAKSKKVYQVGFWSLNRDYPSASSSSIGSGYAGQTVPLEFTTHFASELGKPTRPPVTYPSTPVPTVPDFSHCTKVIAIPENPSGVTDQSCAPCSNGAQKWWPCNAPGLCKCAA